MITFADKTLYTHDDLARKLAGAMTVRAFLNRFGPPKVAHRLWLGADLNDAIAKVDRIKDDRNQGVKRVKGRRGERFADRLPGILEGCEK